MDSIMEQMLELLQSGQYLTAAEMADKIQVSEKTIRTREKQLDSLVSQHGGVIHAKQRKGYRLEIVDSQTFTQWIDSSRNQQNCLPSNSSQRIMYLLGYLLCRPEYVKLEDLCQRLYISRNTLTADLKQAEYIFHLYHLKIDRRPNHGIRLVGEEFDHRLCMANCLVKQNLSNSKIHPHLEQIAPILMEVSRNCKLKLSENAFESLVVHIFVASHRITGGHPIQMSQEMKERVSSSLHTSALQAAKEIATALSQDNLVFSPDEELYLAIHIGGKSASDTPGKYGSGIVISSQCDETVLEMLQAVYEVNKLDFRNNLELRMSLNQHLVPMDIRMKYGIPLQNPMLDQIKREYSMAYTLAATACTALSKHYACSISEDEVGYIAILFALAIEKMDKAVSKKNIILVCVSGRGTSQLFMYKYKQAFGKYLDQIYECSLFDLENFDYQGKKIDYVFTTIPLSLNLPVPVFEVSLFLDNQEVDSYRRLFERGGNDFLLQYYDPALFLPHLQADNKEEALKKICHHIAQFRDIPDDFFQWVWKREEMGQTDFGNLVAIPHPSKIITKEKFVMAAILEKPIWWGHNLVQVVLLMSMSQEEDRDIERFYQVTTNFMFNPQGVQRLIASPTFAQLLDVLTDYDSGNQLHI